MATIKATYLTANIGCRGAMRSSFAWLRRAGCTVSWEDYRQGWFTDTYYNIVIKGPDKYVRLWAEWGNELGLEIPIPHF